MAQVNVPKTSKKAISAIIIAVAALFLIANSYTIIEPDERGVAVSLGQITSTTPIQPGIVWKTPFVTSIETFSIVPKTYEVTFSVGEDGAITKDMQTIGATVVVRYNYRKPYHRNCKKIPQLYNYRKCNERLYQSISQGNYR